MAEYLCACAGAPAPASLIAGLSYEVTRLAGRSKSRFVRIIMYPGMMLQRLTTREPDDSQLEVAIRAFKEAAGHILEREAEEKVESGADTGLVGCPADA